MPNTFRLGPVNWVTGGHLADKASTARAFTTPDEQGAQRHDGERPPGGGVRCGSRGDRPVVGL